MKYKATESFLHDELGAVAKGQDVEATPAQAVTPLMLGYFEPYETKVVREVPQEPPKRPPRPRSKCS